MSSPSRDVGLGTAYERRAIYRALDRWLPEPPATAVEGPVDGMAGIPGLHLLRLARRGTRVTVVHPDEDALERVRVVYARAGLAARLELARERPGRRFDLALTFNLASVADWQGALRASVEGAARAVIFVSHPWSWGALARRGLRLFERGRPGPELFEHPACDPAVLEPELGALGVVERRAFVDCPWWPDLFVEPGETLLGATADGRHVGEVVARVDHARGPRARHERGERRALVGARHRRLQYGAPLPREEPRVHGRPLRLPEDGRARLRVAGGQLAHVHRHGRGLALDARTARAEPRRGPGLERVQPRAARRIDLRRWLARRQDGPAVLHDAPRARGRHHAIELRRVAPRHERDRHARSAGQHLDPRRHLLGHPRARRIGDDRRERSVHVERHEQRAGEGGDALRKRQRAHARSSAPRNRSDQRCALASERGLGVFVRSSERPAAPPGASAELPGPESVAELLGHLVRLLRAA